MRKNYLVQTVNSAEVEKACSGPRHPAVPQTVSLEFASQDRGQIMNK